MGRLLLGRLSGQSIRLRIGEVDIWVMVEFRSGSRVGLLIDAPDEVQIDREEILPILQQRRSAAGDHRRA